ncbi:MAG: MFS transporter [Flavobacteriaceae bacterium]
MLVTAAESIFLLPFVLARIFRPTFLDVFQLTNFELGSLYSIYGIIALLSYVYGGTLADRYPPRKLMATALFLTAAGGVYLTRFPSYSSLQWLYGFWGFSTIFLFWAAMIKATRNWGGDQQQGRAFGYLEAGRGLVAASIGVLGVVVFGYILPENVKAAAFEERRAAFEVVIWCAVVLAVVVGILVLFFLKENDSKKASHTTKEKVSWTTVVQVAKLPSVGLLILIVLCAYCGYKVTDILSLYATEVMLFDEVNAAKVGSYQMYLRPLVCVAVGLFADKSSAALWLERGFIILFIGAALFASGAVNAPLSGLFIFAVIITGLGTYALRTLYFAAVKEGNIPYALTGTAVGIISVVGYTPDIFMGPLMGYLLDSNPGISGHQHVFGLLASFALVGIYASYRFKKRNQKETLA